ncbi:predicted protein [Naegleria gruberi]|uniref:Predicted protein n=1 Tax=Naegleria gruberi TaxID=5762 RepID=D2VN11_NAEGR|nr:uncharacterized protein NAEGRDRAFT_70333 [Naegleria gruberi]EFC41838.1 predicted protein [Naegleria gruberi]|eukprot:XP_002674582.1 predicted protein [Naegleria gruberi strain NEG-M]
MKLERFLLLGVTMWMVVAMLWNGKINPTCSTSVSSPVLLMVNAQQDLSLEDFEQLIKKTLRKDCPHLKKAVKDGWSVCDKEYGELDLAGKASSSEVDMSLIRSGYGYSPVEHEIKLQVLESANASIIDPPMVETKEMHFSKVRDFYNHVYNMNSTSHVAVLYSDTLENAKQTFTTLFKSKTDIHAVDTKYAHYSVKTTKQLQFTTSFQTILQKLPMSYHSKIYERFINIFGSQVMTSVLYGGLVGQTSIIKSCYSSESAVKYSQARLQKLMTGTSDVDIPNTFLKYSKIISSDIIGGNPEISSIKKRVSTFPKNSSPIKFQTVPIWKLIPEENYQREHLKTAYDNLMTKSANKFEKLISDIENLKLKQSGAAIPAKLFYSQSECGFNFAKDRCYGKRKTSCKGNKRSACTGLVNKKSDIHIVRGAPSKVIDKLCPFEYRMTIFPTDVYGCRSAAVRLFVSRNWQDEIQVSVVYSFIDDNYKLVEQVVYVSPPQKQGGCIQVSTSNFNNEELSTSLKGLKWRLCTNCMPMIGKDHSLKCGCPYLV